jgi:hypothetical protein
MRDLADVYYPDANRIRVVMDNLSTHTVCHAEFGTSSRSKPAPDHAANRQAITLESGTASRCNPAPVPKASGHSPRVGSLLTDRPYIAKVSEGKYYPLLLFFGVDGVSP